MYVIKKYYIKNTRNGKVLKTIQFKDIISLILMKCAEVLKLLKITRPTLSSYVKLGKIKVTKLGNGYYDYNDESMIFSIMKTVIK